MTKIIDVHLNKDKQFSDADITKIFQYVAKNLGKKILAITHTSVDAEGDKREYTMYHGNTRVQVTVSRITTHDWHGRKTFVEFKFWTNKSDFATTTRTLSPKNPNRIKVICEEMFQAFAQYTVDLIKEAGKEDAENKKARDEIKSCGIIITDKNFSTEFSNHNGLIGQKRISFDTRPYNAPRDVMSLQIDFVKKSELSKLIKAIKDCNLTMLPADKRKED